MIKHKLYAAFIALLCIPAILSAAGSTMDTTSYCPLTVGMKLTYANCDEKGAVTSRFTMEVTEAEGTFQEGTIVYRMEFFDKDNAPLGKNNVLVMKVVKNSESTTSYMEDLKLVMKVQDLMSKGDVSSIPTVMKEGMTIQDGNITVKVGGVNSSILTHERKIVDCTNVTTNAGTFKTYVVDEVQTTKSIFNKDEKVKSWYAKGLGCVKQEVRNKKGEITNLQTLEKVEY